MQQFEVTLSLNCDVFIPEQFLKTMREFAASDEASETMRSFHEDYPDDDDEFMLRATQHAMSGAVRAALKQLFVTSGVGCRLPPCSTNAIKGTGKATPITNDTFVLTSLEPVPAPQNPAAQ